MRSGGTLGAISLSHASMLCADLGIPQLAMHSAVETMAYCDYTALVAGVRSFFSHEIIVMHDQIEIK